MMMGGSNSRFRRDEKPIPCLPWHQCFAKTTEDGHPGLSVPEHCRHVGWVAVALREVLPEAVRQLLGEGSPCVAAAHDVGKVSPGYQLKYFREALHVLSPTLAALYTKFDENHAKTSEGAVNAYLGPRQDSPTAAGVVVGAHHGERDVATWIDDASPTMGGATWARERRALLNALVAEFGPLPATLSAAQVPLLAGFTSVADWIGSNEEFFPAAGLPAEIDLRLRAATAVRESGWRRPELKQGLSFGEVFPECPTPYPLQAHLIAAASQPGVYVLEAPMGTGKTEAALYAAYQLLAAGHHHGIFFGLPTRVTSDRIHQRMASFLQRISASHNAGLAHGTAWLQAFLPGGADLRAGEAWFHPAKRALLWPFTVGTIDQALLAALNVRHSFVRALGLAGKVVILDEVHTYDAYTGSLLDDLVARLREWGCTVLILSATLTHARRLAMLGQPPEPPAEQAYPLISALTAGRPATFAPPPPEPRPVAVRLQDWPDERLAAEAAEQAAAGCCVVCIANTVRRAQRWYRLIKGAVTAGTDVGLLHSRFPAWRRQELEDRWLDLLGKHGKRPAGCVLVGSQVLEQSLDYDADVLYTELAPTDMLLQRLGRVWRHPREDRPCTAPTMTILAGPVAEAGDAESLLAALGDAAPYIYAPYVLWRTFQVWQERRHLMLPVDIRTVLEKTYCMPAEDEPAFVAPWRNRLDEKRKELAQLAAVAACDSLPAKHDDERAATRFSSYPTLDALLVRSFTQRGQRADLVLASGVAITADPNRPNAGDSAQLHLNLVSVPAYAFPGATTPPCLAKLVAKYAKTPVLVIDPDTGCLTWQSQRTDYSYSHAVGLYREPQPQPATTNRFDPDFDLNLDDPTEDFTPMWLLDRNNP